MRIVAESGQGSKMRNGLTHPAAMLHFKNDNKFISGLSGNTVVLLS